MNETGLRIDAFINSAERFIKRYGADIFAVLAGGFTVAAGVSAFNAGKKIGSKEALRRTEDTHTEAGQEDNESGESNAKLLVQPVVFGTVAVGSIALSRVLGRKREESLLAAGAALTAYYSRKCELEKKDLGRGEGRRIPGSNETSGELRRSTDTNASDIEDTGRGEMIFIEDFTGRRFKSNMENVLYAIKRLQELFSIGNCVTLNEFYELLGIHSTTAGDVLGWSVNQGILDPYIDEEDYADMSNALLDLNITIKYWEGVGHVIHYPVMPIGGLAGIGPCNY